MAALRIEAGTDVAMIGLWDTAGDAEPLPKRASLSELEAAATDGQIWLAKTSGDGSYDAEVLVDEPATEARLGDHEPVDDWRLLKAPSGRLCLSGAEDFRVAKKRITAEDSYFTVPAGDYRVRAHELDFGIPERQLAERIGTDDYAYWKARSDVDMRIFGFFLLALLASLICGIWADWRFGVGMALAAITLLWASGAPRRRDARFGAIEERVFEAIGDQSIEDLMVEFAAERPELILELERLHEGTPSPMAGPVEMR